MPLQTLRSAVLWATVLSTAEARTRARASPRAACLAYLRKSEGKLRLALRAQLSQKSRRPSEDRALGNRSVESRRPQTLPSCCARNRHPDVGSGPPLNILLLARRVPLVLYFFSTALVMASSGICTPPSPPSASHFLYYLSFAPLCGYCPFLLAFISAPRLCMIPRLNSRTAPQHSLKRQPPSRS